MDYISKGYKMSVLESTLKQQKKAEVMVWKTALLTQMIKLRNTPTMWKSMKENIVANGKMNML